MTTPCEKGANINAVRQAQQRLTMEQVSQGTKIDRVLESQVQLGTDLKQAIDGLTRIIMADIETRKDVEQLKKDREILFAMTRTESIRLDAIELRNARCDGAGIFENFPKMWNWYQQHESAATNFHEVVVGIKSKVDTVYNWYLGEMGWRRFIPAAIAIVSALLAIYVSLDKLTS